MKKSKPKTRKPAPKKRTGRYNYTMKELVAAPKRRPLKRRRRGMTSAEVMAMLPMSFSKGRKGKRGRKSDAS